MESLIKKIASSILQKDVVVSHRLLGGMSNYTFVVEADHQKYTFRLPGEKAENFVDRNIEGRNIKLIEPLGITNHTLYLDLDSGIKMAEYVEGEILSTLDRKQHLEAVSNTLKLIHRSGIKALNDYDMKNRLKQYEKLNHHQNELYYDLKDTWLSLYKQYETDPLVLCHGDAQPSNFIIQNDRALVVDFEFSGNNDPYYDIACFGNIDFEDAKALLDVYLGHKATKEELKKLIVFRMFQTLQWHQVAMFKHEIGLSEKLHIPFDVVAIKYLEKATQLNKEYHEA